MRRRDCFKHMHDPPVPEKKRAAEIASGIRAAGERARGEAEARRKTDPKLAAKPREIGGPSGPEPTRYGDWERKGIASDF
jgi:hypothetical protein